LEINAWMPSMEIAAVAALAATWIFVVLKELKTDSDNEILLDEMNHLSDPAPVPELAFLGGDKYSQLLLALDPLIPAMSSSQINRLAGYLRFAGVDPRWWRRG